jgi:hypothetical protein
MSPDGQTRGGRIIPTSNLYTIILALAVGVVIATSAFVAYKCYMYYDTIFKLP